MNIPALVLLLAAKGLSKEDIEEAVKALQSRATKPKSKNTHKFVPDTWEPSPSHREKAEALGYSGAAFDNQIATFREWEFKDGKSNLDLAFHRWLRTNAGRSNGTAVARDFAADRATSRVSAMVEGARIASTAGRRRWSI